MNIRIWEFVTDRWRKYFDIFFGNILPSILHFDSFDNLKECDILFIRSDYNCNYSFDDKAYSPLIDSLIRICQNRDVTCQVIASPFSRLLGDRAFNHPISINRIWFKIFIFEYIYRVVFGKEYSKNWAKSERVKLWKRIIRKSQPTLIIGIQPNGTLNKASKEYGIDIYDLQHGTIVDIDKWYGAELITAIPDEELPSGYLTWDERSADVLRKWAPQKGIDIEVIGNPWFTRFIDLEDDQIVNKAIEDGANLESDKPTIMLSLQWGLDRFSENRKENYIMIEELEAVILESKNDYRWLIRMHPLQIKNKRGRAGRDVKEYLEKKFGEHPNVHYKSSSRVALPVLLKHVDLHITEFSSIVIEAGWFGIKSGLVNEFIAPGKPRENYYKFERSLNLAEVLPHDKEMIKKWISEEINSNPSKSSFINARNNFNYFLDKHLIDKKLNK